MSSPHPPHIQPKHPNSILAETQKHLCSGSLAVETNHLNPGHFQDQFREGVRLCEGSLVPEHLPNSSSLQPRTSEAPLENPRVPSPRQQRSHSVTVRFRGAAQPARLCLLCSPVPQSCSALAPALPQLSCARRAHPGHLPVLSPRSPNALPPSEPPSARNGSHRQQQQLLGLSGISEAAASRTPHTCWRLGWAL